VIRTAVAKKQIRQIHWKEWVAGRPALLRRRLFVMKPTALEPTKGQRIGLVFIGSNRRRAVFGHDPSHEFLNTASRGLGVGTTVSVFEKNPLLFLSRPHRAATA
jgi:hypothetical protein